jgi:hypothetical protein
MAEYVSPLDERVRTPEPLAARPVALEGRRVALLDISKRRGDEFLDRIEELLGDAGARTTRFAKPFFSRPAPQDVIDQVAIHGDLAVEGLAD